MADVQTLIDRNLEFANSFKQGDLGLLPRLSTLIVTCLDARVDPAHFFGLELGAALEVAIVHHTDCGTSRFANPQVRQRLGQAARTGEAVIERLASTDPQTSVAEDLDRSEPRRLYRTSLSSLAMSMTSPTGKSAKSSLRPPYAKGHDHEGQNYDITPDGR